MPSKIYLLTEVSFSTNFHRELTKLNTVREHILRFTPGLPRTYIWYDDTISLAKSSTVTKKLSQFQLKIDLSIVHTTGRNQIHVGFLHFNFQSEIFKQERQKLLNNWP